MKKTAKKTNWQTKELGKICKISTGKSNANEAVEYGEYAFFDRSKTIKKSKRFLFDCEALIIPGEGAKFFPKYYSGKFDLHQRAYALFSFNNDVYIKFVEYYLIFDHKYFERVAVGATAKSLRIRHFQDLEIPLPSLPEQKRIVGILDGVFRDVKKAKENAEKNLANAKELFESYSQNIFSVDGWEWESRILGEVCSLYQGIAINAKTKHALVEKSELPLLRIKDLKNNTEEQYIDPNNYPANALVGVSDIVYTRTGSLGLVFRGRKGVLHNNSFKIVPHSGISKDYLFLWLQNPIFKSKITKLAMKAAQPDITHKIFKEQEIDVPPLKTQRQIVKKLDELSAKTKKLESVYQQKIDDLEELKKSVLKKAFNGDL